MRDQTIPLVVDDIRKFEDFEAARCVYYSIENEEPFFERQFEIGDRNVPLHVVHISGVISHSLIDKDGYFHSAESIEETFQSIEENTSFYIATNDIWVPLSFFPPDQTPGRGEVYRVESDFFEMLLKFRNAQIQANELDDWRSDFINKRKPEIFFSKVEYEAFQEWARRHIETARENYHANKNFQLKRKHKE